MLRAFARRLCPDRIMQPHPVSDVKPCESISWLRRRTPSVIDDVASGLLLRGIGANCERYVIHIRDSKSARKASGQALPVSFTLFAACSERLAWSSGRRMGKSVAFSGRVEGIHSLGKTVAYLYHEAPLAGSACIVGLNTISGILGLCHSWVRGPRSIVRYACISLGRPLSSQRL